MLSCVGDGLFDLCVSDQLLDEIERVLIDEKGLSREKARTFRSAVLASAATIVTTVQCDSIRDQLDGPEHSRDSPRAGAATPMLRSRRNFELSTRNAGLRLVPLVDPTLDSGPTPGPLRRCLGTDDDGARVEAVIEPQPDP